MPDFDFQVVSVEPDRYAVSPMLLIALEITNKIRDQICLSINLLSEFHFNSPPKSLYWTSVSTVVPRFNGSTKSVLRLPCSQDSDLQVAKYLAKTGGKPTEGVMVHIRVICKQCRSEKESKVPKEVQMAERHRLTEERCEVCGNIQYEIFEKEISDKTRQEEPQIPFKLVFYGSAVYQDPGSAGFSFYPFPQLPPKEAKFRVPASLWRTLMENHYGKTRWLSVREETFEMLHGYVEANHLPSIDEALSRLVERVNKTGPLI